MDAWVPRSPWHRVPVGPGSRSEMAFFWVRGKPCAVLLPRPGPGAAGQNKQHSITKNTAKLDRETEELHHDRVTLEVGKVIQQGRQSKGLTQKDLATVSMAGPFLPGCGRAGGRSVFRRRCRSAWGGFRVPLTLAFSGEAVSGQPSLPLECSVASFMHRPQSLRGLLRSKALGPRVVPACAACW